MHDAARAVLLCTPLSHPAGEAHLWPTASHPRKGVMALGLTIRALGPTGNVGYLPPPPANLKGCLLLRKETNHAVNPFLDLMDVCSWEQ